jgi:pimeloyl-ACP methyl ester carboxylesterase
MSLLSDVPVSALQMAHGVLTYHAEGSGFPVVTVHGLPGSSRDFRRLAQAAQGVRMIRLNLPGFGGSTPLKRAGDWDALVDVVADAAHTLAAGPFVLLGHSFGGLVALRAAARSSDARGLALIAPAGLRAHRMVRKLGPQIGLKALAVSRMSRELFYRGLVKTPIGAHATRAESDVTLALLSTLDYAPSRRAVAQRTPVFCASCLDDEIVEPAVVDELVATLNTKRHLSFARGGHAPQRDHAAEVGAALVEFVASHVAPAIIEA